MKIAVSGKGGVGKTTLASGLIRCFADLGTPVYAIDADPDTSLGITLGLDPEKLDSLVPLIEMKDVIEKKNAGGGMLVDLNPDVEDILENYCLKEGQILFFKMGGIKQGGSACYCKENSFLQSILNSLLLDKSQPVIIDMSAGIEHLTRGTARGVDLMLVVTEPSVASVKTSRIVKKLAEDLGIKKVMFVGNKVDGQEDSDFLYDHLPGDDFAGLIPFNRDILRQSRDQNVAGRAIIIQEIKDIYSYFRGGESSS